VSPFLRIVTDLEALVCAGHFIGMLDPELITKEVERLIQNPEIEPTCVHLQVYLAKHTPS
jgi:hypothetical protein